MKNMTLARIAEVTNGKLVLVPGCEDVQNQEIAGAVNDNRKVEKDSSLINSLVS